MTQPTTKEPETGAEVLPPLENGERLDQPTVHARYEAMPEGTRAELIGGIVYMHSPAKSTHGRKHSLIARWLGMYEDSTPGAETHVESSTLLGPENEPQPDCCLLITPECGGQTSEKDEWLVGAPELVVEVALSSASLDLHAKKADYEKCGVREYAVVALRHRRVYWFVLREETLTELSAGPDGVFRSETFPGLWLDAAALLAGNMPQVRAVQALGLASPEHAAFVADLERRRAERGEP